MTSLELYFDGASRGNPGSSGAGAYLKFSNGKTEELSKALGHGTNNQAEYAAIVLGLTHIKSQLNAYSDLKKITIKGDSQLVIKQLQKKWRVKSGNIQSLFKEAFELITDLRSKKITIDLQYIPRNQNSKADKLANIGADQN